MEKIILSSGKEFPIITCGINVCDDKLNIDLKRTDESLSDLEILLSDPVETGKIKLLSETGEELQILNGYTILNSLMLKLNVKIFETEESDVISVELEKPDQVSIRLDALESQITDTQMALCEIYEGLV